MGKQRARAAELEHNRMKAQVEEATEAIVEAHASGDAARAEKLGKERSRLEGAVRQAGERLEGARLAVTRAETERGLFAAESLDGLIAEREPDARAAAQAVEDAVEQLRAAQAQWTMVETDAASLLRLAGRSTNVLPRFPEALAALVRDARRAGGVDVPAPLPPALQTVTREAALTANRALTTS